MIRPSSAWFPLVEWAGAYISRLRPLLALVVPHFFVLQVLLSVVAQETANVVPQFSEATRTIILYAFAWGHVADELMQMIETKRETGTHAAYFGDSGNYVDLIRCVLFILT